ncbi:hypothetical protein V8E36_009398 [Tilletia maclaganii]
MRYITTLATLIVTLLIAVTVKALWIDVLEACINHCKSDKTSSPGCVKACERCSRAVQQGYLPQDDYSMPPSCESHCGHDNDCTGECHQFQKVCCLPSFGCCPYQAQFCHCRDSDLLC